MPSKSLNKKRVPATAGFGLVELLVTMTIMALVSAIVLVNESSFKSSVVMRNQAYEVAFMLRQAQLLAVNAIEDSTAIDLTAGQRFGVRIDSTNNTVTLFSGSFSGGTTLDQRRLDSRFRFSEIITDVNGSFESSADEIVDIVFKRPNFDAEIFDLSGNDRPGVLQVIIGMDSSSATRKIEVLGSGSITVLSN